MHTCVLRRHAACMADSVQPPYHLTVQFRAMPGTHLPLVLSPGTSYGSLVEASFSQVTFTLEWCHTIIPGLNKTIYCFLGRIGTAWFALSSGACHTRLSHLIQNICPHPMPLSTATRPGRDAETREQWGTGA
ncbi:hypothetical protein BV20DRAFT_76184 [Pilatotrama ljubarskyi]|nr:hypothetical protein BV20DRAFT_76184 [Pilatotrama ljubarskyi]